jgi:hypothetical protein
LGVLSLAWGLPSLANEIGVYSGRHYNSDQELYKQFTAKTGITAKQQGREGFHANPLATETVGGQLVAGLQEGQGHAFGFFAGAIDPGDALDHLNAAGLGAQGRINQDRLPHGHADWLLGAIGEMAELHRGLAGLLRAARNIAGPRGFLRIILNCNKPGRSPGSRARLLVWFDGSADWSDEGLILLDDSTAFGKRPNQGQLRLG